MNTKEQNCREAGRVENPMTLTSFDWETPFVENGK